jgi:predicted transposase/invertase (TIGR01784 family)
LSKLLIGFDKQTEFNSWATCIFLYVLLCYTNDIQSERITMAIIRYLDPTNDLAFKRIFGTEKNKDILIHFLNDVLSRQGENGIKDVTFLNTVLHPTTLEKKSGIIDVLCTDEKGIKYIVEMQVGEVSGFAKRAQFYASQVYVNQVNKGESYYTAKEVVFLALLDFIMFKEKEYYKSEHIVLDKRSFEHDLKDFSYVFVELKKFSKTIEELETNEDRWLYFFKHTDEPENMDKLIKNSEQVIKKAYDELSASNWTNEELLNYEALEKVRRDIIARESLITSRAEEAGRMQVLRMLINGKSIEEIMELTGLSRAEIENDDQ